MSVRLASRALGGAIEVDAETGLARRWYPLGARTQVVLDPLVAFGRLRVAGSRVTTASVYDFHCAEGRSLKRTCAWFALEPAQVRAAVRLEEQIAP